MFYEPFSESMDNAQSVCALLSLSRLSMDIVLFRFSTDSMDDIRGIHGQCLGGLHEFPGHSADWNVRLFI